MAQKTLLEFNDKNNGEVIPVYAMKAYESITRCILNLNTRWRCVVSFMPQPLYLWENIPANYSVEGWVDPTDKSGQFREKEIYFPCYLNP